MSAFFDEASRVQTVTFGAATFELPVRYYRDDAFALFFAADHTQVCAALPSKKLFPIRLPNGKALIGVAAFNYLASSFGPYGEMAIVVPVVHGHRPPLSLVPGLLESRYPGFGNVVLHMPVTRLCARDAGRGGWGYPKFVSDMRFTITPEALECRLTEGERHILTLHVERTGMLSHDTQPLISYTVLDRTLLRTTLIQRGVCKNQYLPKKSWIALGDHEVADSLRNLGLVPRPLMSRYFLERAAILPAGVPVERDVLPLEGYRGRDIEGNLEICYPGA